MASSSNRHWPSLFKSKPCNTHQWQHDLINHCHKPSLITSGLASEERSPEPKPRWNPKPEQIRILEAIFNSGMVNPPRDEIRKIRAQLQEYGQVGDANVFYWFQNRKSRSKHKQRQRQQSRVASTLVAPSSTSSSLEKSTGSTDKILLTGSVNQNNVSLQIPLVDQLLFPPGYNLQAELSGVASCVQEENIGFVPGLWTELMMGLEGSKGNANVDEVSKLAMMQSPNLNPNSNPGPNASCVVASGTSAAAASVTETSVISFPVNEIHGVGGVGVGGSGGGDGAEKPMVFINGMGFEVVGPLNVREVFGEEAVLIHSSGHPVLTNQWGFTLHPLQHGASYFLI